MKGNNRAVLSRIMNSGRIRILFIVKRITRRNHPWHTPLSGPIDSRFSLGIITSIARLPIFPPTASKIKVFLSALFLGNAQCSQSHNPSHYPNVITGTPNNVPTDPNVGPWVQNCSLPGLAVLTGCLNCQKLRKMHDCKWPITVLKLTTQSTQVTSVCSVQLKVVYQSVYTASF